MGAPCPYFTPAQGKKIWFFGPSVGRWLRTGFGELTVREDREENLSRALGGIFHSEAQGNENFSSTCSGFSPNRP